ncbi:unnamed protein product [Owenia fusiformis]|nr:unnamed protein product [Owenia fusiformis]
MPKHIPKRVNGCRINGECIYSHSCPNVGESTDCSAGWTGSDEYTLKLSNAIADSVHTITGYRPHLIANHLYRDRMDANRPMSKATFMDQNAMTVWQEFHSYIEEAKSIVGTGLLLDIHAHGRRNNWIQLGYTLPGDDLNSETLLNASKSSVYHRSLHTGVPFEEFLRGNESLGGLFESNGYITVPAPGLKGPGTEPFLAGGYNTMRHGSRHQGTIDAIQVEFPQYIRRYWKRYAHSVAESIVEFTKRWYQ